MHFKLLLFVILNFSILVKSNTIEININNQADNEKHKLHLAHDILISFEYNHNEIQKAENSDFRKVLEYHMQTYDSLKILYKLDTNQFFAHPRIANSLSNIGDAYFNLGDYNKALEFFEKSLAMFNQVFPENEKNENKAKCLDNIAHTQLLLGDYRKALESYFLSFEMKKSLYIKGHIEFGHSFKSIGQTFFQLEEFMKSAEYFKHSLEIFTEKNDLFHMGKIAEQFVLIGVKISDLELAEKGLDILKKTYFNNESHPHISKALFTISGLSQNLGVDFFNKRDYNKALELYKKAYDLRSNKNIGNSDVGLLLNSIADCYISLGEYTEGLVYYKKALNIYSIIFNNTDNILIANIYNSLGLAYNNLDSPFEAFQNYIIALQMFQRLNLTHRYYADCLFTNGLIFGKLGFLDVALSYFEQALNMRKFLFQNSLYHGDVGQILFEMGRVFYKKNDFKNAVFYLERSLEHFQNTMSDDMENSVFYIRVLFEIQLLNEKISEMQSKKPTDEL